MPRLILLNGPPGIGKSTLAQRYVDENPLALNLDVDSVRSLLGGWMEHQEESGGLARALGFAMARVHLLEGHDVVVPQLLARVPFIEALESLAAEVGATFHEIVLLDGKANAVRRFDDRSRQRSAGAQPDAQGDMIEQRGDAESLGATYDRLMDMLDSRNDAQLVHSREGDIDRTYAAVLQVLTAEP